MCKMAHFENCDPETADQEYCIFHKPTKNEEEAREFYNKFVLKFFGYKLPWNEGWVFAGPIDAKGFVFPEIPSKTKTGKEFTFENVVFESMALFDKAIFEGRADFCDSKFNGSSKYRTSFNETIFKKRVSFSGAHFSEVYFIKTSFKGRAYFDNSIFEYFSFVDVIFNETAKFDNTKFIGKLYRLDNTRLQFLRPDLTQGGEYYKRTFKAEFMKSVSFESVFSSVIIDFSQSVFHDYVRYNNACFVYGLECHQCKFNGTVTGYFTKFQTYMPFIIKLDIKDPHPYFETLSTNFDHSVFKETAMFIGAEFGRVVFNFAVFERGASFNNATFHDEARFRETKFRAPVEFHNAVFVGDAKFESTFFESIAEFPKAIFLKRSKLLKECIW
ncbi:pentapeptide repeat-containing protein [Thermococcus sp.]|uniref:pentapeptide repeat-containing protein n=1 Tax=Thermococcus sp. TaxID=35749 RepID=UPI00260BD452|nr:pentapeptide repeat-containing protein [Thermococcus sp.]